MQTVSWEIIIAALTVARKAALMETAKGVCDAALLHETNTRDGKYPILGPILEWHTHDALS
jgi:hypothetical protein